MQEKQEKLLREFIRKTFVSNLLKEQREEHAVRSYVRSMIAEVYNEQVLQTLFEAKDMANPHPNTGINKLRDAIRKAKPSIKTKYQQLTTDSEQRESFKNQLDYHDYTVLEPRTLAQWRDTGMSSIFNDCMEEGNKKKKALVIFYCSTLEQVEQLKRYGKGDSSDVRNSIEQKYARLGEFWGAEIKTIFLRYE